MYTNNDQNQHLGPRTTNVEEEGIDIKLLFNKLLGQWWIFLISIGVCGILALIFLRYSKPLYNINSKILIQSPTNNSGIGGAADALGNLGGLIAPSANVNNEVEILTTHSLMESTVRDMDLNVSYYNIGEIRTTPISDAPFKVNLINPKDSILTTQFEVWPLSSNLLKVSYEDPVTDSDIVVRIPFNKPFEVQGVGRISISRNFTIPLKGKFLFVVVSVDKAVTYFQNNFTALLPSQTATSIDISLKYPLQKQGENILNKLIQLYIHQNIVDKNQIADSTIAFIENRLMLVSQELGGIEGNIQRFKQSSKLADIPKQSELLVATSAETNDEITKLDVQLSLVNGIEDYLKDEKSKRIVPSSLLPQDPVFAALIDRYNTLLKERERQLLTATESNPFVVNIDEQIAGLRQDMLSSIANIKRSIAINKGTLRGTTGRLESQIKTVPKLERTYLDLSRQQQVKQQLYLYLLQKREEIAVSKTSNISNARIIDEPKAELLPFYPNKLLIFGAAIFLGFAFPIGRTLILDFFNNRILSREDITKYTDIPIIGEISHNTENSNIVVTGESRSAIAEQYRALRTNLGFLMDAEKQQKVLLVTSSMSGEGKSFSSINLGLTLALQTLLFQIR